MVRFGWIQLTNALRGNKEIRLHPKAFVLLRYLGIAAPKVTTESLLETIWPAVNVTEAVLSVYVAEIRKALGEDPKKPAFIETLHRRGYRFIAPVTIAHRPGISQSAAGSVVLIRPIMREAATVIGAEPIIGREKDLSFLREKLEAALHGTGSVCLSVVQQASKDRGTRIRPSWRAVAANGSEAIRKNWKPSPMRPG